MKLNPFSKKPTAYYDKVVGDILFSTVEEAEESGYRPARTRRKNS